MVKNFKHPFSFEYEFGKELLVNGKNILSEIDIALRSYHSGDFREMGLMVGSAIASIVHDLDHETTEIKMNPTEDHIVEFFNGFFSALIGKIPDF